MKKSQGINLVRRLYLEEHRPFSCGISICGVMISVVSLTFWRTSLRFC